MNTIGREIEAREPQHMHDGQGMRQRIARRGRHVYRYCQSVTHPGDWRIERRAIPPGIADAAAIDLAYTPSHIMGAGCHRWHGV